MNGKIEKIRDEIDQIDHEIIKLIGKRVALINKIAQEKKKIALPVFQKKREREMLEERVELGKKLNLKPIFIKELFQTILKESRSIQLKTKEKTASRGALTESRNL